MQYTWIDLKIIMFDGVEKERWRNIRGVDHEKRPRW